MGKIIQFPQEHPKKIPQLLKLKELSDEIDELVYSAKVQKEINMIEIIGVMSHRLGNLLQRTKNKAEVWKVCQEIVKEQSLLD